jgi:hypothetical protein
MSMGLEKLFGKKKERNKEERVSTSVADLGDKFFGRSIDPETSTVREGLDRRIEKIPGRPGVLKGVEKRPNEANLELYFARNKVLILLVKTIPELPIRFPEVYEIYQTETDAYSTFEEIVGRHPATHNEVVVKFKEFKEFCRERGILIVRYDTRPDNFIVTSEGIFYYVDKDIDFEIVKPERFNYIQGFQELYTSWQEIKNLNK